MKRFILLIVILLNISCKSDDQEEQITGLTLESISIGSSFLEADRDRDNISTSLPIVMKFNIPIDRSSVNQNIHLLNGQGNTLELTFTYSGEDKTISALPASELANNTSYTFQIGA